MKTDAKFPFPALFAALLTALFTLSGCASAGSTYGNAPGADLPAELAAEPPSVWVSGDWFYLDRPAYVIVFEIRAGRLVRVLYPPDSRYRQRRLRSGFHRVWPLDRREYGVPCLASPVVYRLAVASHEPFRLRELEDRVDFRYRPAFGFQFIAHNVYGALDDLLVSSLPGYATGGETGWGVDYQAVWICDVPPPRRVPSAVMLASEDGRVLQLSQVDTEGGSTKEASGGDTTEGATPDDRRVEALHKGPTPRALPADELRGKRVLVTNLPERRIAGDMKRTLRPESPLEPRSRNTFRQPTYRDRGREGGRSVSRWRSVERRGTAPSGRSRAEPARAPAEKRKPEKDPDG